MTCAGGKRDGDNVRILTHMLSFALGHGAQERSPAPPLSCLSHSCAAQSRHRLSDLLILRVFDCKRVCIGSGRFSPRALCSHAGHASGSIVSERERPPRFETEMSGSECSETALEPCGVPCVSGSAPHPATNARPQPDTTSRCKHRRAQHAARVSRPARALLPRLPLSFVRNSRPVRATAARRIASARATGLADDAFPPKCSGTCAWHDALLGREELSREATVRLGPLYLVTRLVEVDGESSLDGMRAVEVRSPDAGCMFLLECGSPQGWNRRLLILWVGCQAFAQAGWDMTSNRARTRPFIAEPENCCAGQATHAV